MSEAFEFTSNKSVSGGSVRRVWFGWVGKAYVRPQHSEDSPWPRIAEETQRTPWRLSQRRALDDVFLAHDAMIERYSL